MNIDVFLFLGIAFFFTFLIGRLFEKIKVPWIFASLIIGAILSVYNPFSSLTSSASFSLLAQLGLYFLLFIIGFELDLGEFKKRSAFIVKSMIFIVLLEAMFGTLLIHFVFGYSLFISFMLALSFATVGEAILIPILDEFGIVNTSLGQLIIGIGTLDDVFEVIALFLVVSLIGTNVKDGFSLPAILLSIGGMILLAFAITKLKHAGERFKFYSFNTIFFIVIFMLFIFLGIGAFGDTQPLAALLAGIALRNLMPKEKIKAVENEVRAVCYGLFAPIFFLSVGISLDAGYILTNPLLILLVVFVTASAKMLGSFIVGLKKLGAKASAILGVGLSVRFSTSLVVTNLMYTNGLIGIGLYSVIIASTMIFTFGIPIVFSNLLSKWGFVKGGGALKSLNRKKA